MIKKLPVDDLIKSIVGEENAGAIIENLGDINYNIPYTPTFDEGKSNILLQLKPEPLEIKYTEPIQVQEEGQEPAENLITVTIEAEKNGVYAYDGKKLTFVIKATGVKVGDVNFPISPLQHSLSAWSRSNTNLSLKKKKMEHACAQDMLFFYTFVKKPTIQNDYNRKHSKRIAGFGRFQVSGISFCPGFPESGIFLVYVFRNYEYWLKKSQREITGVCLWKQPILSFMKRQCFREWLSD